MPMAQELTPKQEKFALAYIETGNAAEAYRIAYDAENMKPVTTRRKAAELLQHGSGFGSRARVTGDSSGTSHGYCGFHHRRVG